MHAILLHEEVEFILDLYRYEDVSAEEPVSSSDKESSEVNAGKDDTSLPTNYLT